MSWYNLCMSSFEIPEGRTLVMTEKKGDETYYVAFDWDDSNLKEYAQKYISEMENLLNQKSNASA